MVTEATEEVQGASPVAEPTQAVEPGTEAPESPEEEFTGPSFLELSTAYDEQYEAALKIVPELSVKSTKRVLKKLLGYPMRHDEVDLKHPDEKSVYALLENIQQIKTNMMMEGLRLQHEEMTQEMQDKMVEETTEQGEEKDG